MIFPTANPKKKLAWTAPTLDADQEAFTENRFAV